MGKFSLKSIKKDELFIHTFVEKEFPSEEESGIFSVLQVTLTFEASATSRDSLSMFLLVLAFRLNKLESLSFSATEFLLFLGSSTVIMLPMKLNLLEHRTLNL